MTNRKLLYGYKIQDGGLSVVMEEAAVVSRVYSSRCQPVLSKDLGYPE